MLNLDKRVQISLIGIFAVVAFTATGFVIYESARNLRADGEVAAPVTSPAAETTPAIGETPLADTTTPAVTVTVSPGEEVIGATESSVPSPGTETSDLSNAVASSGFDFRYLLLIIDGVIVAILLGVLVIRLLLKVLSQADAPAAPVQIGASTPQPAPAKGTGPVTVDQLDVDIPL